MYMFQQIVSGCVLFIWGKNIRFGFLAFGKEESELDRREVTE